jgi:hypothetical protein
MIGSAILEVAASRNATIVAAAFAEKVVQVWDLPSDAPHSGTKIAEFSTVLMGGAKNLAVHPNGKTVIAGASKASGGRIAAYAIPSGRMLWERRKLRYPSNLRFAPSGEHFWYRSCANEAWKVEQVDAATGATVKVNKGLNFYEEGSYGYTVMSPSVSSRFILWGQRELQIRKITSRLFDVAFAPDCVYLAEMASSDDGIGGPLRCIDYADGSVRWRNDCELGSHILGLYYNARDGFLYAFLRRFAKEAYQRLIRFDAVTGHREDLAGVDGAQWAFVPQRDQLVTSDGEILELSTGRLVGHLDFPRKEYPDRPIEAILGYL